MVVVGGLSVTPAVECVDEAEPAVALHGNALPQVANVLRSAGSGARGFESLGRRFLQVHVPLERDGEYLRAVGRDVTIPKPCLY